MAYITDRHSFENLKSWLIEIEKNAKKNVYKLIIGNKSDLEIKRQVTLEEGNDFSKSYDIKFFETSAKTGFNVDNVFELLSQELIKAKETNYSKDNKDKEVVIPN